MHFAKGIHKKRNKQHTAETHKCKTQSEKLLSMCVCRLLLYRIRIVSYCNCNCNCSCVYYVSVCVKVCLLHIYILSKAIECLILFVCFDTPKLALQNAIIYSLGATRPYQDLDTYYIHILYKLYQFMYLIPGFS